MFQIVALLLFVIFAANVTLGSVGVGVFLNDVSEMMVLLAAAIAFVVVILKKEAADRG